MILLSGAARADVGGLMRRGNGLFARGKFDEALAAYQQAEVLEPDATAIHFNLGNALHKLGRYDEALREHELVLTDKQPKRRADALYNIGNTMFKAGRLDQAIASYKASLVLAPGDRQAKQNLEYCLKKREEQQQQPDSSSQNQQQQQQQQQQVQPQQGEMDRDQAEGMMQALENKERDQQEKSQQPRRQKQVERDW